MSTHNNTIPIVNGVDSTSEGDLLNLQEVTLFGNGITVSSGTDHLNITFTGSGYLEKLLMDDATSVTITCRAQSDAKYLTATILDNSETILSKRSIGYSAFPQKMVLSFSSGIGQVLRLEGTDAGVKLYNIHADAGLRTGGQPIPSLENTSNVTRKVTGAPFENYGYGHDGLFMSPDGTKLVIGGDRGITTMNLDTPYDVSGTFTLSTTSTSTPGNPKNVPDFSPDGLIVYMGGRGPIVKGTLSTPYDSSTVTAVQQSTATYKRPLLNKKGDKLYAFQVETTSVTSVHVYTGSNFDFDLTQTPTEYTFSPGLFLGHSMKIYGEYILIAGTTASYVITWYVYKMDIDNFMNYIFTNNTLPDYIKTGTMSTPLYATDRPFNDILLFYNQELGEIYSRGVYGAGYLNMFDNDYTIEY